MNRRNRIYFEAVQEAQAAAESAIGGILSAYIAKKNALQEQTKVYVETEREKRYRSGLEEAKRIARDGIKAEEDRFRQVIKRSAAGLRHELKEAVSDPVPPSFLQRLSMYKTSGLAPSRTEIETLMAEARGSIVAVNALAALLKGLDSPLAIKCRSVSDFEKDIQAMTDLAADGRPLPVYPMEQHTEMTEVFKGQPRPIRTGSGYVNRGHVWQEGQALLIERSIIVGALKDVISNADAWTADITSEIVRREDLEARLQAEAAAVEKGEPYTPEAEPASSTTVTEESAAIKLARELGKQSAVDMAKISRYVR